MEPNLHKISAVLKFVFNASLSMIIVEDLTFYDCKSEFTQPRYNLKSGRSSYCMLFLDLTLEGQKPFVSKAQLSGGSVFCGSWLPNITLGHLLCPPVRRPRQHLLRRPGIRPHLSQRRPRHGRGQDGHRGVRVSGPLRITRQECRTMFLLLEKHMTY